MNKRHMQMVLRRIKAEPKRWAQGAWHVLLRGDEPCKTKHCIAGWAQVLKRGDKKGKTYPSVMFVYEEAIEFLDINEHQAQYLFFRVENVKEIEKFIKSGGKVPK